MQATSILEHGLLTFTPPQLCDTIVIIGLTIEEQVKE